MSDEGVLLERVSPNGNVQAVAEAAPACRGDPVTLLWAVPITEGERALARSAGRAALTERLAAAGATWVHRDRTPVAS
ncbi:MAG TPA: suppressor of fused domain protein [Humisphaera sp.]